MAAAIEQLQKREDLKKCIDNNVLKKALAEAAQLYPHLNRLNAGKASVNTKDDGISGLKKRRLDETLQPQQKLDHIWAQFGSQAHSPTNVFSRQGGQPLISLAL